MKDIKFILVIPFYLGLLISVLTMSFFGAIVVNLLGLNQIVSKFCFLILLIFWGIIHFHFGKIIYKDYFKTI